MKVSRIDENAQDNAAIEIWAELAVRDPSPDCFSPLKSQISSVIAPESLTLLSQHSGSFEVLMDFHSLNVEDSTPSTNGSPWFLPMIRGLRASFIAFYSVVARTHFSIPRQRMLFPEPGADSGRASPGSSSFITLPS
jgi:hypothetical protein